ncbi:hypothetical protein [Moraxella lacunata]|uniref:hypothetical protein n=1 Tax=Moraxella lacunata TaxID=477 RepID=UPI003EE30A1E
MKGGLLAVIVQFVEPGDVCYSWNTPINDIGSYLSTWLKGRISYHHQIEKLNPRPSHTDT